MKFPNKITTYKESSLPKMVIVLNELEKGDLSIDFLYEIVKKKIPSFNEYLEILVSLYALDKVILNELEELHLC